MATQEQRRAAVEAAIAVFRNRVEAMLRTVGEQAMTMRATASTCSRPRSKTSERAEAPSKPQTRLRSMSKLAAGAAEELSSSIAEISRQLGHTNNLVQIAVEEAGTTNVSDRLARPRRRERSATSSS